MSRSLVFAGLLSAAALLGLVTANVAGMNTIAGARADDGYDPVSYTHLTLPTILRV